jgi:hypothetical protein
MREIRKSGSEGGAGQTNVPFLPLSEKGAAFQGGRAPSGGHEYAEGKSL